MHWERRAHMPKSPKNKHSLLDGIIALCFARLGGAARIGRQTAAYHVGEKWRMRDFFCWRVVARATSGRGDIIFHVL